MIPKTIHYCWFGGNPLPKSALRCIESWKKFFPGHEIRQWDESNFDVNAIPFTSEAYARGKYAFVSDYARFKILHDCGGLYFDTDVEVVAPMEDLIQKGPFMGIEKIGKSIGVNAGLGLAAPAGLPVYKEILDHYVSMHFEDENGVQLPGTVVKHVTDVLKRLGFEEKDEYQNCGGIDIYPSDYFNPLDDATGRLNKTANTRSIHWYSKTWCDNYGPTRTFLTRWAHRILGVECLGKIKNIMKNEK